MASTKNQTGRENQRSRPDDCQDEGVDLSLIQWMLGLTPLERLQAAQAMIDAAWALRNGKRPA